jgi:hypothetical protein
MITPIELAQAIADSSVKDIADWTIKGVVLFMCGFVWRTNMMLVELRMLLRDPDSGLLAQMRRMTERLDGAEQDTSHHSSRLDVHHTRLDGHDREIGEINRDRRHYVRRASDRERGA